MKGVPHSLGTDGHTHNKLAILYLYEVGGWLIERYLNVVQRSVETERFGPWSVISCKMH